MKYQKDNKLIRWSFFMIKSRTFLKKFFSVLWILRKPNILKNQSYYLKNFMKNIKKLYCIIGLKFEKKTPFEVQASYKKFSKKTIKHAKNEVNLLIFLETTSELQYYFFCFINKSKLDSEMKNMEQVLIRSL